VRGSLADSILRRRQRPRFPGGDWLATGSTSEVTLDGLNVVMVGSFQGNIWSGEATNSAAGFFLDERADERQGEALQAIFGGQAGGWPAGFAELMEEVRGIEFAPIDFEIADEPTGASRCPARPETVPRR
jgi:hypothetical protein